MEDNYVFPNQVEPQKKVGNGSSAKGVIVSFLAIFTVLGVGGISYILGRESNKNTAQTTTSTESTLSYEAENLDSPTPIPVTKSPTTVQENATSSATPTKAKTTATPTPNIKNKTLTSTNALDGFRSSNNGGNSGLDIRSGRNTNLTTRGFVSFDLDDIPQGATIFSATLRLYQAQVFGDPYGIGGNLKIDHLNFGDSLDESDFDTAPILTSFATLSSTPVVEWKEADVTNAVKNDVFTQRDKSQFRIHFTNEEKGGDVKGDFVYFESSEDTYQSGFVPQLVVKYY